MGNKNIIKNTEDYSSQVLQGLSFPNNGMVLPTQPTKPSLTSLNVIKDIIKQYNNKNNTPNQKRQILSQGSEKLKEYGLTVDKNKWNDLFKQTQTGKPLDDSFSSVFRNNSSADLSIDFPSNTTPFSDLTHPVPTSSLDLNPSIPTASDLTGFKPEVAGSDFALNQILKKSNSINPAIPPKNETTSSFDIDSIVKNSIDLTNLGLGIFNDYNKYSNQQKNRATAYQDTMRNSIIADNDILNKTNLLKANSLAGGRNFGSSVLI